jgi:hypothetical protein
MGTRADFYVGRGRNAEWLGSIAYDGRDSVPGGIVKAKSENKFRRKVAKFLAKRDDATFPEQGWPWPWNDSGTTDTAYAFDDGHVYWKTHAGWRDVGVYPTDAEPRVRLEWPDMSSRKNVTLGPRSGVIVVGLPRR